MSNNMKLWKQAVFFALSAGLSSACTTSAPPPVPVNAPPVTATPAGQTAQPDAPATGHDHADHALEDKMPRVNAEELRRLLAAQQAVVVDVRSAEEYAQAHIEGAINLPIQQIETSQYPKLPRGQRLISYCT